MIIRDRKKFIVKVIIIVLPVLIALNLILYYSTYNNPIIIGNDKLYEQYKKYCLSYSHTLMEDFLGVPTHAQIICLQTENNEIVITLISVIPPARTKVWHSEGDAPYWKIGFRSYTN